MKLLAAALLLPLLLPAQTKPSPASQIKSKPAPRLADGHPDLSGFWKGPLLRTMFQSSGGPHFTAAGEAAYQANLKSPNPEGLCLFAGIPRASISGVPFEIIQTPTRIAFLYELMTTWRTIPVGGQHPAD